MIQHYGELGAALEFFNRVPPAFQKGFCKVFGVEVRCEEEILQYTENFYHLMWEKVQNGKVISQEDIYLIRGRSVLLGTEQNGHHWPPKSRDGIEIVRLPADFHIAWHHMFKNLSKIEELNLFLERLFEDPCLDSGGILYATIDIVRKEVEKKQQDC